MRGTTALVALVIILLATWQVQSFLYVPLAPKKADYERKVPKKIDGRAIARPLSVFNYGMHERFKFLKEAIAKATITTPSVCIYKKAVLGADLKMKVLTFAKVKFQKKLTNVNVNPSSSKIPYEPKSTSSGVFAATTNDPIKYTNPENSSTSPYQNSDKIQISTLTSPSMPPTETTTTGTTTSTTTTQKTTPTPSPVMSTSTTQKYYTRILIIRR